MKFQNLESLFSFLESNTNKSIKSIRNVAKGIKLHIHGAVQGVGFRPFVYNLAQSLALKGSVKNIGGSVEINLNYELYENIQEENCKKANKMIEKLENPQQRDSNKKDSKQIYPVQNAKNIELFLFALLDICGNHLESKLGSKLDSNLIKNLKNRYFKQKDKIIHNIFLPHNAFIESIDYEIIECQSDIKNKIKSYTKDFTILESSYENNNFLNIKFPLDYRICDDCLKDLGDKSSRFYNYAFTTCINCAARYSIINALPYDRKNTSMRDFVMCKYCQDDYANPQSRRFHTQPISCPKCAIKITGWQGDYDFVHNVIKPCSEPINTYPLKACGEALLSNKVVVFKGLGGFAFLANARSDEAIKLVRVLKNRPTKPFAVMARLTAIKKIAIITPIIKVALQSRESPIVLALKSSSYDLSSEISSLATIAVMTPYSAMLMLLFSYLPSDFTLLYTSANKKGNMIATSLSELGVLEQNTWSKQLKSSNTSAFILDYRREITHRMEDSIVSGLRTYDFLDGDTKGYILPDSIKSSKQSQCDLPFIRIARGYAPMSLHFKHLKLKCLTASFGGMQKSSIAFGMGRDVVMTPFMGELFSVENVQNYVQNFEFFCKIYGMPELFIIDKHEGYESSKIAQKIAGGIIKNLSKRVKVLSIYHHHAHLNALLIESGKKSGVGVIFDGSGLGMDGMMWGGEFLRGDFRQCERLLYFKPFRILGGEKHIKDALRLTLSYAFTNKINKILEFLACRLESHPSLDSSLESSYVCTPQNTFKILEMMSKTGLNSPLTSSVGRLFDIAGFIIFGLESIEYEGQSGEMIASLALKYVMTCSKSHLPYHSHLSAINLIDAIDANFEPYSFEIKQGQLDISMCFLEMFCDMQNLKGRLDFSDHTNLLKGKIALRFIDTLSFCILESLKKIGSDHALFGGGVFANFMLVARVKRLLKMHDITCFFPRLPCNDYSIALGQIAFGSEI